MDSKDDAEPGVDPRLAAIPDSHGHAKGEHKPFLEERPIPYTARMLFLWFYHACRRGSPRFMMVADHMNYLTFEDPAAVNLVRRALKLAQAGDLFGAAETAGVEVGHAEVVSKGLRRGMRYSIGAEVDNDPRSRPDAQNIVDAMRPDGMVRSVHFLAITHPTHGENWMWAFDNPEFKDLYEVVGTQTVWEIYMATLLDAIDKLPGNIIGHFYVPAIFGHWPDDAVLEGYEDALVDACAERGMAIELNSRYLYKHYAHDDEQLEKFRSVHVRLLRKAVAKGVAIAVGSDAHSPKDQGRAFEAVLALLDEVEINEIAFPIGGRLARVALRATEEFMKQFAPPEPEPAPPAPVPEVSVTPDRAAAEPAAEKPKKPRPSRAKKPTPVQGEIVERDSIPMVPDPTDPPPPPPGPGMVKHKPPKKKKSHGEGHDRPASIPMVPDPTDPPPPPPGPGMVKHKPTKKKKPTHKPVAKKAPAKAAKKSARKPVAKKAAAKKTVAKKKAAPAKRVAKKTTAKSGAKKSKTAKKTPAKKAITAKKSPSKKAAAKKAVVKKSVSKSAKRSAAKKPAAKKASKKSARRR